jgi:hypothetical protein
MAVLVVLVAQTSNALSAQEMTRGGGCHGTSSHSFKGDAFEITTITLSTVGANGV